MLRRRSLFSALGLMLVALTLLAGCGSPRVRADGSERGFDHLIVGVPF